MNIYKVFKGLDQVIKDWPKMKSSIKEIEKKNRLMEKRLNKSMQGGVSFRDKWPTFGIPVSLPTVPTKSSVCKQSDFLREHHKKWCSTMKIEPAFHRKQWEFVYVLESLYQRGMMASGKRGLGFAVGSEPVPAVLASFGCEIVATDLHPGAGTEKGWTQGNQLCFGIDDLNKNGICAPESFRQLCSYRPVDMNAIPEDLRDFDFNWSSCSFEHLGSIERGLAFLKNQLQTLKPGGWAVHTTEYNISSNDETMEEENCVIFRQRDIEKVVAELKSEGHTVVELDYSLGWLPYDYKVDMPPYAPSPHLRLRLGKFVCTSIGIIIQKKA